MSPAALAEYQRHPDAANGGRPLFGKRKKRAFIRFQTAEFGYLATAAVLMGAGYRLWQDCHPSDNLEIMALDLLCYLLSFALLLNLRRQFLGPYCVLGGLLIALGSVSYGVLTYVNTAYQSDAILFNHYSALLFLDGLNPYAQSMVPAYRIFNVPQDVFTPTTNGDAIYSLSYPALSFLIYVPFLLLSIKNMIWVSVAFQALATSAIFFLSPIRLRYFTPLIFNLDPSYLNYTLGGVTDIIWVLPMIFAAYYWDRRVLVSALCLGIAISLKQNAWLVVPFALIHWGLRAKDEKRPAILVRTVATLLAVFALANAPFIVIGASDWVHGALAPLSAGPIPYGSGLVQIISETNMPATALSATWLSALAFMVFLYFRFHRQLDVLPFLAPAIALFFASRSLENYFMYWPPIALAYILSSKPEYSRTNHDPIAFVRNRKAIFYMFTTALFAVISIAVVQARVSPISISILQSIFDDDTKAISEIRVSIQNHSVEPLSLRFAVFSDNKFEYWNHGFPTTIGPRSITSVLIQPNDVDDELRPTAGHSVQVVAVDATGREYFSQQRRFYMKLRAPDVFVNGALTDWSLKKNAPIGWNYDPSQLSSAIIARSKVGGRQAIRFNISTAVGDGWHLASVNQIVPADFGKVIARLYPTHDFEGGSFPSGFFGVELIDALNHHYIITISSRVLTPETLRRTDGTTYEVLPGHLNEWNDISVDLETISQNDSFLAGAGSYLSFNITSALYGHNRGSSHDAFGGIFEAR